MNRVSSLFLTIAALLAALAADAQHVDVVPRRIEVGFNKTVHILFPSPVTYIDIGSMDIIAGKAAGAENVVRVKAAVRDFPKETNLTVITEDGGYYSFDARYAENPQVATHEIGAATSASPAVQTPPAEGRVLLEATGRERPAAVKKTLNDIYRLNRTEMRLRQKQTRKLPNSRSRMRRQKRMRPQRKRRRTARISTRSTARTPVRNRLSSR